MSAYIRAPKPVPVSGTGGDDRGVISNVPAALFGLHIIVAGGGPYAPGDQMTLALFDQSTVPANTWDLATPAAVKICFLDLTLTNPPSLDLGPGDFPEHGLRFDNGIAYFIFAKVGGGGGGPPFAVWTTPLFITADVAP